MSRNTVGGFQGPVAVLTPDGVEVARAACRYRAELDGSGEDHWRGQLHRIIPPGAVTEGAYRLRFPDGEQGEVTVQAVAMDHETVYFEGAGTRPLYPL